MTFVWLKSQTRTIQPAQRVEPRTDFIYSGCRRRMGFCLTGLSVGRPGSTNSPCLFVVRRWLIGAVALLTSGVVAQTALAAAPSSYDKRVMRGCFGARSDVIGARFLLRRDSWGLSPATGGNVLVVRFLTSALPRTETDAVVIFGRDGRSARDRGAQVVAAAPAGSGRISAAGSTGNVAFVVLGPLTSRVAGGIRECFARSARYGGSPL